MQTDLASVQLAALCRRSAEPSRGRTRLIRLFCVALALVAQATTVAAATLFVAPDGQPANAGTIDRPLDLPTVLSSQGPARPGDTIWLRGGTYRRAATPNGNGDPVIYHSTVSGSASAPIVFRQYPGERATLDGNLAPDVPVLVVDGAYTTFWGFEITNSAPNRYVNRGTGLDVYGHHNKFINLVIHDTGIGMGFWSTTVDDASEVSGTLIYNVGYEATDRGHGHSLYVQNLNGTKRIVDNIMFNGFSFGIHAYGQTGRANNLTMEGNMLFNHGGLSATSGFKANLLIATDLPAEAPRVRHNYGYYPAGSGGRNVDIGYCNNGLIEHNYLAGGTPLKIYSCPNTFVTDNTLYGPVDNALRARYPGNVYGTTPTGLHVGVRRNLYEAGRAHVVVYNWDRQPQVPLNLADAGLAPGDLYEIRDAQNYFAGPIVTGTYAGGTVTVPMAGLSGAPVIGNAPIQPGHTSAEFGVFIVQRRTTSQVPIATLTATPSTVEMGRSTMLAWSTLNATSVSIAPGIGNVPPSGTRAVIPSSATSFTLTASNGNLTTREVVTVLVISPDGSSVPENATQIIDTQGAIWTIGANNAILRNGAQAAQGAGTRIVWRGGTIYVYGLNQGWWKWTGSGWIGVTAPPPGSSPPTSPVWQRPAIRSIG